MSSRQGTLARLQPAGGEPGYGAGTQALGSSDDSLHEASFPSSPILGSGATLTDTYIKDEFQKVLDGTQTANVDFTAGVDMDYGGAPILDKNTVIVDQEQVKSGKEGTAGDGRGMSAGPFVPTTASPSDGATNAEAQPGVPPVKGNSGQNGSILSPRATAYSYDLDGAYVAGSSALPVTEGESTS